MFIVFEGIDGSGKTTQSKMLYNHLKEIGVDVVWTKEPWDKTLVKDERDRSTDLFTFGADRILHCENFIKPALEAGKTVICDRFYYSTIAYQRNHTVPLQIMQYYHLIKPTACGIEPDINIYLRITTEEMLRRKSGKFDQIEQDQMKNYEKIIDYYDILFDYNDKRHFSIDGSESIESIKNRILKIVLTRIS